MPGMKYLCPRPNSGVACRESVPKARLLQEIHSGVGYKLTSRLKTLNDVEIDLIVVAVRWTGVTARHF